jgi:hypothetical protein
MYCLTNAPSHQRERGFLLKISEVRGVYAVRMNRHDKKW